MDIYTIGGGEIIYEVLGAVTRCLHGNNNSLMEGFIRIGLLIGAFMLYMAIITNSWLEIVKSWLIPVSLVIYVCFLPTSTVWVHDEVSQYHKKLDNVPYGLALFSSQISKLGKLVTDKIEQNFSTPDDLRYHKTGMMFGSNILEKSKSFKITNQSFKENMRNFVGQCVKYDIMLNSKYSFDDIKNSTDIWSLISSEPSKNRGMFWLPIDERGKSEYVTCAQAVDRFNKLWKPEIDKTAHWLGLKLFSGRAIGHSSLNGHLTMNQGLVNALKGEILQNIKSSYSYLGDFQQSSEDILKQALVINALEDVSAQNSHQIGNGISFAEVRGLLQQKNTYETLGRMAAKVLPLMKAIIEALVYACFIFIVPLSMIPNGYRFLFNWCALLIWLQVWAPMYAVLNYIMNISARASTISEIGTVGGITIANMVGVSEANAEMRTLAGYLSLSIPFLCIAIVKGVSTFVHLTGQLTGVTAQAGAEAARDITSGNFSYGNLNISNTQAGNLSQFQRSFSSSLSAADHTFSQGTEQIRYGADGSHVFHNQRSTGRYEGNVDSNQVIAKSMALQDTYSQLSNISTELTKADSMRGAEELRFAHQISNMDTKQLADSLNVTSSEAKSLQEDARLVVNKGKSGNYSDSTSASIGPGTSLGSIIGINGGISAGTQNSNTQFESSQAQSGNTYNEAKSNLESASRSLSNSQANSDTRSTAQNYAKSVDKVNSLSERKSFLEQEANNLSRSISQSSSLSTSSRYSLNDDVREELVSRGFSHEQANRMIENNTHEAKEAIKIVEGQRMHSIPEGIAAKNTLVSQSKIQDMKREYTNMEDNMKREIRADIGNLEDIDVGTLTENHMQNINKEISAGKSEIDSEKSKIHSSVEERSKENVVSVLIKPVKDKVKAWLNDGGKNN